MMMKIVRCRLRIGKTSSRERDRVALRAFEDVGLRLPFEPGALADSRTDVVAVRDSVVGGALAPVAHSNPRLGGARGVSLTALRRGCAEARSVTAANGLLSSPSPRVQASRHMANIFIRY